MRRPHDFYPTTHEGATEGLLFSSPVIFGGVAFECCSGRHHMTRVLRASNLFERVLTNDVVPSFDADYHFDATNAANWEQLPPIDWVITNPPFALGLPILRNALRVARCGIAFYLRITFWEPTIRDRFHPERRRGFFLRDHPPTGFMPMSRISHTEDGGTDSATCAWFVWDKVETEQWHKVLILSDTVPVEGNQPDLLV